MLPGDELVADYLARAGRAAAAVLPPADCALVIEEVGRRVRARVGAPPRWDLRGTQERLTELGPAEELVDSVGRELVPAAFEPAPEPPPEAAADVEPETDHPTVDLGAVPRPVLPAQADARVSESAGIGSPRGPSRPIFDDAEAFRVRPIGPDESVARDSAISSLNRLGWELAALVVLGVAVFPFGYLGWVLGAVLIMRSRYWEISDKVRVLFGLPAAAVGIAVLWAWLESTQIQESNSSATRLSEAGGSLADSFAVMPEICGVLGAVYLAYALVRDNHTS